jgi:hypothetical protein
MTTADLLAHLTTAAADLAAVHGLDESLVRAVLLAYELDRPAEKIR